MSYHAEIELTTKVAIMVIFDKGCKFSKTNLAPNSSLPLVLWANYTQFFAHSKNSSFWKSFSFQWLQGIPQLRLDPGWVGSITPLPNLLMDDAVKGFTIFLANHSFGTAKKQNRPSFEKLERLRTLFARGHVSCFVLNHVPFVEFGLPRKL